MSNGAVYIKDALEIRDLMRQEIENGNRFVSFEFGKQGLTKDDFVAFKTAIEAHEYAYKNTTDRDNYVVRSINSVEKGMNQLLAMPNEKRLLMSMKKEIGELLNIVEGMQQKNACERVQEVKLDNKQLSR